MNLKVVPAVFGRLGGFRPGSGRFEAPDVRRIPEKPLVSCLCVTENRHAFMPWLLWGFDRQVWKRRELVIIDSSDPPLIMPKRPDVRVLHVPPGTSLGKKRNMALDAAEGQVVAWFDDDDWQHPRRLSFLVPLLREYATKIGASFIGPSKSYFLDVRGNRSARYQMHRYAIFNGSIYYTDMVRHARFPEDVLRTEDTRWISTLLRKRQGAALVNDHPTLFFWLCHAVNVTNANHVRKLPLDANELIQGLGSAWSDTPLQLAALRNRLAARPANRPVRVQLAEPVPAPTGALPPPPSLAQNTAPEPPPTPPRTEPKPPPFAVPARTKLSLYLARARGRAGIERSGYVTFSVSGSRYGWVDAVSAIAAHRKSEWAGSDFVGIFDDEAGGHPDALALARALESRSGRGGVCVVGRGERRSLRTLLADCANAEELASQVLARLSIRDPYALDRDVVSLESGWLAPPGLFAEYVRNWLLPARTVLAKRRDPRPDPASRRVLELLPGIAFAREGRAVRSLGLGTASRIATR